MTTKVDPPIRQAATMILLRRNARETSVLMGMRGAKAAFMPSKYVFPGGAVDPEDADATLLRPLTDIHQRRLRAEPRPDEPANPHAIAAAALRELVEETGLVIGAPSPTPTQWPGYAEKALAADASTLRYVFRAITPPGRPRRFDAHFFIADAAQLLGNPDEFGDACDELSHLHWVPLTEARNLNLPFITEVVLAEIAEVAGSVPHHQDLPDPDTVPFFDNRGTAPRFSQIA
ncbi:NUDIX hydrolase [Paracoccus sp. Z330]|uniref:NUDIX hydrolase n=1 Tax=Paracoccus onchidii TaxID=3017813 RepID=A0ABT4ZCE4_9RHOB|nr:NUDIX hydrolase [Paracoccus onchidii]MDB6176952.1 NUDIX hydrolase [Paracoccus onchidii]